MSRFAREPPSSAYLHWFEVAFAAIAPAPTAPRGARAANARGAARQAAAEWRASVEALAAFRSAHLALAKRYLRATRTGTGASSFASMLGQARDATAAALHSPP